MKFSIFFLILMFFLSACAPSPDAIQKAVSNTLAAIPPMPTYTAPPHYPTYTPYPTWTVIPTNTNIPLPTATEGPTNTPIPSNTPLPTLPPEAITATAQYFKDLMLYGDHNPGVYLVNVDISPGIWRNNSTRDDCYWKRADKYGNIIDNYFGFGGGTIYIAPTDFSVELNQECGTWTYIAPP